VGDPIIGARDSAKEPPDELSVDEVVLDEEDLSDLTLFLVLALI
jgi:hypothetical protein